jgi:endonuclease G, mitochondrial
MAAPPAPHPFDVAAAMAAGERWAQRADKHEMFDDAVREGRYSDLDSAERVAKRTNRLVRQIQTVAPGRAESLAAEVAGANFRDSIVADALLERVIGETRDFLFIEFLHQALYVSRAVARIVTKLPGGKQSYATGFMVSPRLLLTNHHVLGSPADARKSSAEFNYERDRTGQPLKVCRFPLDPATFFLNDKALDFALVAVGPCPEGDPLSDFGWCPLVKEEGKIVVGEPINIVQHPRGDLKQIVMRENRITDMLDPFTHYEADTEPGSSGSPVFNNQWEVVALHHSGVPKRNAAGELCGTDGKPWKPGDDANRLAWVGNEGVRVSRLVDFIANADIKAPLRPLRQELLDAKPPVESRRTRIGPFDKSGGSSVTITVPVRVTVTIGEHSGSAASKVSTISVPPVELLLENIQPDPEPGDEAKPTFDAGFTGLRAPEAGSIPSHTHR